MKNESCEILDEYDRKLDRHREEVDERFDTMEDRLAKLGIDQDKLMEWHALVMKREARKEQLYNAIIEKTFTGLVWAAIVFIGKAVWDYLHMHIR